MGKKIKDEIFKFYGLELTESQKIDVGSAELNLLKTKGGKCYIRKEFQEWYGAKEVEKEVSILNHLAKKGISVPKYVLTLNNQYYYVADSGKTVILQEFITGITKDICTGSRKAINGCSENLAEIVMGLSDFEDLKLENIQEWINPQEIDAAIEKCESILQKCDTTSAIEKKIAKDMKDKIKMLKDIKGFDLEGIENISHYNTHGDYNVLQLIFDDKDNIVATLDFVTAKKLPIVWEIIRSYSYIDSSCKDGLFDMNNFIKYVKIFHKKVKLNEYDIKNMTYVYLIQILTSSYGYNQYFKDKTTSLIEFGFFRTNLARYLYKNANTISCQLMEELKK